MEKLFRFRDPIPAKGFLLIWTDDDEKEGSEEKVDKTPNQNDISVDEQISNKLDVEKALEHLTEKESFIIEKLFWDQMSVKETCKVLDVSKNAGLKSRRNALKKMKKALTS